VPDAPHDLVSDFFTLTQDEWSPEIFRKWAGISLVAGALERRIWIRTGRFITFPNLYTLLVAPPGTGKQIISTTRDLIFNALEPGTKSKAFRVADKSVTKASLIDTLFDSKQTRITAKGDHYSYSALFVGAEEFSVLLPAYDMEFIGALNGIYNNEESHTERRRHGHPARIDIEYPVLNMLGGIQPSLMSSSFPEEVWTTGLGRRCIMVFSSETRIRDPFLITEQVGGVRQRILTRLGELSRLQGEITWAPDAIEFFQNWWMDGGQPIPSHSKLNAYCSNRAMNVMKLSGISAISRGKSMQISLADATRAVSWLLEAETTMPDIFRAMTGKSDQSIIEELHRWGVAKYIKDKNEPLDSTLLYSFVSERAPSEKVKAIVELAEKSGAFVRQAGTEKYIPKGVFLKPKE